MRIRAELRQRDQPSATVVRSQRMELYSAGFNGLNVTRLTPGDGGTGDHLRSNPEDLHVFTRVLAADRISPPVARLCYTIGTNNPNHSTQPGEIQLARCQERH